ncbi:MAG: thiol reductant ABC exporter subunit CydC [Lautropia sp.]|nr:thiol reductant ABC exporter subunit CydC [Lautropia sp.]
MKETRTLRALLLPLWRRQRRTLALACLLALITALASVGLLGVAGGFITATALVTGALATFNLFVPSATVRALAFIRILSRYAERITGHAATLQLLADLRQQVFARLIGQEAGRLARWRDGDLVARLTGDIDALDSAFLLIALPWLVAAVCGLGVVMVLAIFLPSAALLVGVLWLCLLLPLPWWLTRRVAASGDARQREAAELRQQVLQAVEGHADLLALGADARALAEAGATAQRLGGNARQEAHVRGMGVGMLLAVAGLCTLAVVTLGAGPLAEGRVDGIWLAGGALAVAALFECVSPLLRGASRLGACAAAARRVSALSAEASGPEPVSPVVPPVRASLHLQGLHFRHHPALPLLEGVDLCIAPGERVLIRGESGCGKSTLLAIILGLVRAQRGHVRWGDVDLQATTRDEWHRRIVLLPQQPSVFMGSVRDNLCIGRADADDAALWQALEQAGLAGEVRALPHGLDEWLGEGGRTLSAGQARRLCLARVLLSDAALIVLDEPTEGLDAEAERAFFLQLPAMQGERSILVVTHADVPAGVFDSHWVLKDGRLLASNG